MANSVDPDQTAPIGAVCSGSTLIASILNLSVMLGNYLQQTTSADDIFRCIFFFLALLGLTFYAQMDYSFLLGTINFGCSIVYINIMGSQVIICKKKYIIFLSLKVNLSK